MNIKNLRAKATSAVLAGMMGLSMCAPAIAMAAPDGYTDIEGTSGNANITIEAEATTINMTVPTNAAFVFKADGTNVYPSNYEITNNNTLTAVTLDSIDFEGVNDWQLTDEDDTFQADVKKFALKMGLKGGDLSVVDKTDGVAFSGDTEILIAPEGKAGIDFEAKRGVFSEAISTEDAMDMTMHFNWEQAPVAEEGNN